MSHPSDARTRHEQPRPLGLVGGAVALLTLVFGFAEPVAATPAQTAGGDAAAQCLDAYSEGQRARKGGEFAKARQLLALCGGTSCPTALHGDCQRWLSEVESATPTSVFRVLSPTGEEIRDVKLAIDEAPPQVLDGRAVQFDPGEHWLEFSAPGFHTLRQKQSFPEGEKLLLRDVQLQPTSDSKTGEAPPATSASSSQSTAHAPSLPPPEASGTTNAPFWLGVGAAAAGAGGFSYFGLEARRDEKALASCSPNCTTASVERVEREYLFANISLGVGVLGVLGAAAWLVFKPEPSRSGDTTATAAGWELRVDSNSATLFGRF